MQIRLDENSQASSDLANVPARQYCRDKLQSIAAADGATVVAQMSRRTRFYQAACIVLAALAGLSFAVYFQYVLPEPTSNTAFGGVGLVGSAINLVAGGSGGASPGLDSPFLIRGMLSPQEIVGSIIIVLLLIRRRYRLVLASLVLVIGLGKIGGPALIRSSSHEVQAAQITEPVRIRLETAVDGAEDHRRAAAAYALAQLAYLENDPDQARSMLTRMGESGVLGGRVHRQRLAILDEWLAATGHPLSTDGPKYTLPRSLAFVRGMALTAWYGGISLSCLLVVPLVLAGIAIWRRRRIEDLVSQRLATQGAIADRS